MDKVDIVVDKWLVDLAISKGLAWRLWENDRSGLIDKLKSLEGSGITDVMMQYAELSSLKEVLKDPLLKELHKHKMFKNVDLKQFSKTSRQLGEVKNELVMQEASSEIIVAMAKSIGK